MKFFNRIKMAIKLRKYISPWLILSGKVKIETHNEKGEKALEFVMAILTGKLDEFLERESKKWLGN